MQGAGRVLVDLDAAAEQRLVDRAGGAVLHEMFVFAVQQQAHPHPALRRHQERTPQLAAWNEIGVGDHDVLPGLADGLEVRTLDIVPVTDVVAQQQRGTCVVHPERAIGQGCRFAVFCVGLAAVRPMAPTGVRFQPSEQARKVSHRHGFAQGLPGGPEFTLSCLARSLQPPPELLHGFHHVGHHRAGHPQRKVQSRRHQPPQSHVILIVDDVDAAAKAHLAVHHAKLSVQASPATRDQQTQATQRRVDTPANTRLRKAPFPLVGDPWRAHPIDHQSHQHTPLCRTLQRLRHAQRRAGELEDIGFQMHRPARGVHGLHKGREQLGATRQQQQLVPAVHNRLALPCRAPLGLGTVVVHNSNSAISGKWSDMRAQARPCGTWAETGSRPRTYTRSMCSSGRRDG